MTAEFRQIMISGWLMNEEKMERKVLENSPIMLGLAKVEVNMTYL